VDALIKDGLSTAEPAKRDRDYAEASRLIWADRPVI